MSVPRLRYTRAIKSPIRTAPKSFSERKTCTSLTAPHSSPFSSHWPCLRCPHRKPPSFHFLLLLPVHATRFVCGTPDDGSGVCNHSRAGLVVRCEPIEWDPDASNTAGERLRVGRRMPPVLKCCHRGSHTERKQSGCLLSPVARAYLECRRTRFFNHTPFADRSACD